MYNWQRGNSSGAGEAPNLQPVTVFQVISFKPNVNLLYKIFVSIAGCKDMGIVLTKKISSFTNFHLPFWKNNHCYVLSKNFILGIIHLTLIRINKSYRFILNTILVFILVNESVYTFQ